MRVTIYKRIFVSKWILGTKWILVVGLLLVGLTSGTASLADSTKVSGSSQRFFEVRGFMRQANKAYDRAEFDSASALYDSVLAIDPNNPDASYRKGKILALKGDTTSAVELLTQAVDQNARSARLKIYLARLHLALNETDRAIELTQSLLDFRPNEAEALYIKGSALLQAGDSAQALGLLEKALKLNLDRDRGNGKK